MYTITAPYFYCVLGTNLHQYNTVYYCILQDKVSAHAPNISNTVTQESTVHNKQWSFYSQYVYMLLSMGKFKHYDWRLHTELYME